MEEFIYFYNYRNFTLRIISDTVYLKSIDFCAKKKSTQATGKTPSPLLITVQWLNSYFNISGSDFPEVEFFNTISLKNKKLSAENKSGKILLDLSGYTEKEIRVYKELLQVKAGSRISYGALAEKSSIPSGARFIGNTMSKNRFPVIIPCHRVIRSDGSMGNYTGGIHIKKFLLDHESRA